MTRVTYIEFSGKQHNVDVADGNSVMQGATGNLIPGIDADCGGACACATCHVYIAPEWQTRVGAPSEMESSMLEIVDHLQPNSRLSCQVKLRPELDGLIVHLPESQG